MKRLFFVITAIFLFVLGTNAQTKKDGTPEMRYEANKGTYNNTYSSPPRQTNNAYQAITIKDGATSL